MLVLIKQFNALGVCSLQESHALSSSGKQHANSCSVSSGALGLDAYVWHLSESLLFVFGITKPSLENDCEL